MAGNRRRKALLIGLGLSGLLLSGFVLAPMLSRSHPGQVYYQAHCAECHDRDGVLALLDQRVDEADRLFAAAHVQRHVADPHERAQLISYLKREMDG